MLYILTIHMLTPLFMQEPDGGLLGRMVKAVSIERSTNDGFSNLKSPPSHSSTNETRLLLVLEA